MPYFEFYTANALTYTARIKDLRKKNIIVSTLRLAAFIAFGLSLYFYIRYNAAPASILSVFTAVCFIVLVRISITLHTRRRLAEKLLYINENELKTISHQPNNFDNGKSIAERAIYAEDLDIFGPRSLYHLLNRTTTSHGAGSLASLLNKPHEQPGLIRENQEAVKQMAPQADARQMITAQGLLHNEEKGNLNDLANWMEIPSKMSGLGWLNVFRFILPAFNLIAFYLYLDTGNPILIGAGIAISWSVTGAFMKYILQQHDLTSKKQSILEQYAAILQHFQQIDAGPSKLLAELKTQTGQAHSEIRALSRLTALFDQRLNLLVNFLLNSFFLYDIQCMIALEKWKMRNKPFFRQWTKYVGDIETLQSLAAFAFNNPRYCYPVVDAGIPYIRAVQAAHPLISSDRPVANDIPLETPRLLLITGSNMSGKSTFLRTVGINLLLAQCGAPVYAEQFAFTPMHILSSIRISDSLQDNTSYFMAELKRLRDIIEELEKGRPALVLIDEVLRGTNSDDKTHGSEAFIRKLLRYSCLGLFATHDLALSRLEQALPDEVANYCFESVITNGELLFDYQLQKGVAKNKNASFLMEKMGII